MGEGVHGCLGGCMVAGGHAWLPGECMVARGACMVAGGACVVAEGHAWFPKGGMHG